eukprot:g3464.t1
MPQSLQELQSALNRAVTAVNDIQENVRNANNLQRQQPTRHSRQDYEHTFTLKNHGVSDADAFHAEKYRGVPEKAKGYVEKSHYIGSSTLVAAPVGVSTTWAKYEAGRESKDETQEQKHAKDLVCEMLEKNFKGNASRFKKAMSQQDGDLDGAVTHDEFVRSLRRLGTNLNATQKRELVKAYDPHGRGIIDFHEVSDDLYKRMGKYEKQLVKRTIKKVLDKINRKNTDSHFSRFFRNMDVNNDGKVTKEELRHCLRNNLGLKMTDFEYESLMNIVDKNRDGKISYTEFARDLALADIQAERGEHTDAVIHEVQHSPHMRRSDIILPRHKAHEQYSVSKRHFLNGEDKLDHLIRTKIGQRIKNTGESAIKGIFEKFDADKNGWLSGDELRNGLSEVGIRLSDRDYKRFIKTIDGNGDNRISYNEFCDAFQVQHPTGHASIHAWGEARRNTPGGQSRARENTHTPFTEATSNGSNSNCWLDTALGQRRQKDASVLPGMRHNGSHGMSTVVYGAPLTAEKHAASNSSIGKMTDTTGKPSAGKSTVEIDAHSMVHGKMHLPAYHHEHVRELLVHHKPGVSKALFQHPRKHFEGTSRTTVGIIPGLHHGAEPVTHRHDEFGAHWERRHVAGSKDYNIAGTDHLTGYILPGTHVASVGNEDKAFLNTGQRKHVHNKGGVDHMKNIQGMTIQDDKTQEIGETHAFHEIGHHSQQRHYADKEDVGGRDDMLGLLPGPKQVEHQGNIRHAAEKHHFSNQIDLAGGGEDHMLGLHLGGPEKYEHMAKPERVHGEKHFEVERYDDMRGLLPGPKETEHYGKTEGIHGLKHFSRNDDFKGIASVNSKARERHAAEAHHFKGVDVGGQDNLLGTSVPDNVPLERIGKEVSHANMHHYKGQDVGAMDDTRGILPGELPDQIINPRNHGTTVKQGIAQTSEERGAGLTSRSLEGRRTYRKRTSFDGNKIALPSSSNSRLIQLSQSTPVAGKSSKASSSRNSQQQGESIVSHMNAPIDKPKEKSHYHQRIFQSKFILGHQEAPMHRDTAAKRKDNGSTSSRWMTSNSAIGSNRKTSADAKVHHANLRHYGNIDVGGIDDMKGIQGQEWAPMEHVGNSNGRGRWERKHVRPEGTHGTASHKERKHTYSSNVNKHDDFGNGMKVRSGVPRHLQSSVNWLHMRDGPPN